MADDREYLPDLSGDAPDDGMTMPHAPSEASDEYPLRSAEDFEGELAALEAHGEADAQSLGDVDEVTEPLAASSGAGDAMPQVGSPPRRESEPSALESGERLRQPRAQNFRRRLRNQIGMLPLALYLLALGAYLIARRQDVKGLPDLSTLALIEISILAVGFTAIFHALLSGRRERGLLFAGLYIWVTAGLLAGLVYGIESQPEAAEWWPLLLASAGVTLVVSFVIERGHDARLVLLGICMAVAAGAAYWVTSGRLDADTLNQVADYWPLLLSVAGLGLLPLAFRRRTG